ncbi:MAG TPA: ABC transporter ATP-binding protein [Blastocatellia bacterium]|jgi:ATP-binding cassette subfamily B protein|nr:ABC transporter ATP-binding protein [Blastocatellia bacterium]
MGDFTLRHRIRSPKNDKEKGPGWRERVAALRYILPLVKLVWQTHRGYTSAMVALRLFRAFIPVATLWIGKLIIDGVVAMRESGPDLRRLWRLVALEIVVVLIGEALARTSALTESLLGDLFSNHTSVRLMEHASRLDLYHFEDPNFYDQLERARRQTTQRIAMLSDLISMGQDSITLASLGGALLVYSPWLLLLLAVAVLPSFLGETHFASLQYSLFFRWTPERRSLDYLRYVGASDVTAKEVQMFGLAPWIVGRFRALSDKFYEENKRLSIRRAIISTALSILGTAGYYGAYAIILARAVTGSISIGTLTFLAGSFARSRDLIQRLLMGASDIYQQSLYLKDLFDFFEMKPAISSPEGAPPVPDPVREGFVFDDVGFRYPESDAWAVRHVNFRLHPGERIAFVGENGAGKTTLTKLLARLYDPTEGRILLDGRDIREYDLSSLRRAIGVIFQDFVRYALRFDENIGVGEIEKVRSYLDEAASQQRDGGANKAGAGTANAEQDGKIPPPIISAADKSLASSLLPRFTEGYRQMLGRRFEGGVDLSGGEWQKVALARAYMRDAQVLILDEPTAALDARAEYEVFIRFSQLVRGRMAVIISHRFSTVRMADRIIVLKNGVVVEDGPHDDLVTRGGLYAELFALQAEGYR